MRLLLDSHTLLWWWREDAKLSASARIGIADSGSEIWVSAATGWEIATKVRLGKLDSMTEPVRQFQSLLAADGFRVMSVTLDQALHAGSYTMTHRDPFDRMLAAQAELEGLTLVTRDSAFADFPVQTLW